MQNIIVVQCTSTGKNYIQDIIDRNCNPVILEVKTIGDNEEAIARRKEVKEGYESINADFELIYEKDTYEETLKMVKELDPLLIIPGTEDGVILATKLANDLNLLCNPIENLDAMTLKDEMQNRLAQNNLRHIKGKLVSTIEEAIEFYDKEELKEVVLKPIYSAGTVGLRMCKNKEELIQSFEEVLNLPGLYGNVEESLLIQERINGTEYIVNTVSSNGIHRVTTIWKYNKATTSEGGQVVDTSVTVNELGLGEGELVEYAYDVADAIGIKYGPVHGEYMIDEKGPVLIEVNCRPCGANMEADFLDKISGQHETDSSLDSYLNPEKFKMEQGKGYRLNGYGALKLFITPKDLIAKSSPMKYMSNKLKSHYKTSMTQIIGEMVFEKTQHLENASGIVYLAHEDGYQVQKDIEFLRSVEQNAFQLVLSEELKTEINHDEAKNQKEIKDFIKDIKSFGTCLLISDTIYDDLNVTQVMPEELKEINGKYGVVIVNLNKSLTGHKDDQVAKFILNTFDRIKERGIIIIPKATYDTMPNGRLGAEALLRTLNLKIELPIHQLPKMLIASKR